MDELTLGQLKEGRTKAELDACKETLLIIASNMYYDGALTNYQYNEICSAIITIRDVSEKSLKNHKI